MDWPTSIHHVYQHDPMDQKLEGLVDIISKFSDTKSGTVVKTDQQRDSMRTAMTRLEIWAKDWQMVYNES